MLKGPMEHMVARNQRTLAGALLLTVHYCALSLAATALEMQMLCSGKDPWLRKSMHYICKVWSFIRFSITTTLLTARSAKSTVLLTV